MTGNDTNTKQNPQDWKFFALPARANIAPAQHKIYYATLLAGVQVPRQDMKRAPVVQRIFLNWVGTHLRSCYVRNMSQSNLKQMICHAQGTLLLDLMASTGVSRNHAKRLLDQKVVFVNGKRVWMAKHVLQRGDRVSWAVDVSDQCSEGLLPQILYDHAGVRVYNNAAGVETTGSKGLEGIISTSGPHWHPVHRLDKDTTGCVLFCESTSLLERFKEIFAARLVEKTYEAIARGSIKKTLRCTKTLDGLEAISLIEPIQVNADFSWLRVTIETGRKHQIRRHLALLNAPVLGDPEYSGKQTAGRVEQMATRQMLHARTLGFPHPADASKPQITAPRPKDFTRMLTVVGFSVVDKKTNDF